MLPKFLILALLIRHFSVAVAQEQGEGEFLKNFLQNALPDGRRGSFNWSDSPCKWPGVTCTNPGDRIRTLVLPGYGLQGTIPQGSIGKLDALVRLDLSKNSISGTIPSDIWSLPLLEDLNLSLNRLGGSISIDLKISGSSSSIFKVDLSKNTLSGPIPGSIGILGNLTTLNLNTNNLQDQIPQGIFNCVLLQHLDLSSNKFQGAVPSGLSRLNRLETLLLGNNLLQGFEQDLGRLHYLKVLDLSGNAISGSFPRLEGMRQLGRLNVSGNFFHGTLPNAAFRLPQLSLLSARDNRLSGLLPSPSIKAASLQTVDLGMNSFIGSIPDGFWNLSSMEVLRLDGNNLTGGLPLQLGAALRQLDLRNNLLQADIPGDVSGYRGLEFLDLSSNMLTGRLPERLFTGLPMVLHLGVGNNPFTESTFPELPQDFKVEYLNLSGIRLSGGIPSQIGDAMTRLKQLDLSHNGLYGSIPESLSDLASLDSLDLSYNHLNGSIPETLGGIRQANFSYNDLSGEVPPSLKTASSVTGNKGICGSLVNTACPPTTSPRDGSNGEKQRPGKADGPGNDRKRATNRKTAVIIGVVTGGVAAVVCLVAGLMYCNNRLLTTSFATGRCKKSAPKEERYISMSGPFSCEMDPSVWAAGIRDPQTIPVVMFEKPLLNLTFADLLQATSNFAKEYQLTDGGWGPVFRGSLGGGMMVAIKILGEGIACSDVAQAAAQLEAIARLKHPNVAPLLGYCMVGVERLLVYDYVQDHGDLFGKLHELPEGVRNPEDWSEDTWENDQQEAGQALAQNAVGWGIRHRVALATARALAFLHHGCSPPVVHRDVKAANVLLDAEYEARLAGTGLSALVEMGIPEAGYFPPGQEEASVTSPKGDVYAFGVLLLELVTGKRPVGDDYGGNNSNGGGSLVNWTRSLIKEKRGFKALDVKVMKGDEAETTEMLEALRIGYLCTADPPAKRPTMQQVVGLLKDLRPDNSRDFG